MITHFRQNGKRLEISSAKYDRQLRRIQKLEAHRKLLAGVAAYQLIALGFHGQAAPQKP